MEEKEFEISDSDLAELKQVLVEMRTMFKNKTWEVLEGLSQELQIRGKAIELFSRGKRLKNEAQNN